MLEVLSTKPSPPDNNRVLFSGLDIKDFEFRSICPIVEETELRKYYSESINWQISREKYFDFSAVFSLRKILKNFNEGSDFHIFTLKTGFLFMLSNIFLKTGCLLREG